MQGGGLKRFSACLAFGRAVSLWSRLPIAISRSKCTAGQFYASESIETAAVEAAY